MNINGIRNDFEQIMKEAPVSCPPNVNACHVRRQQQQQQHKTIGKFG